MEATIASLEDELATTRQEKDEAVYNSESLASDLEALSVKLSASNLELSMLQEEVSGLVSYSDLFSISLVQWVDLLSFTSTFLCHTCLSIQRSKLEEYESYQKQLKISVKELEEEKENIAMVL